MFCRWKLNCYLWIINNETTKFMAYESTSTKTLKVDKHNESGEVIGHGMISYTVEEQSNGEDNLDSVWLTVHDLDGCYPDTVRDSLKDEYHWAHIEVIDLPIE